MDNKQDLQNKIEEQNSKIEELKKKNEELSKKIDDLILVFRSHEHNGNDGTIKIKEVQGISKTGDAVEIGSGVLGQVEVQNGSTLQQSLVMSVGVDKTIKYQNVQSKDIDNSTIQLSLIKDSTIPGLPTYNSVLLGASRPIYNNTGKSITVGGNTISDSSFNWQTNELAGSYIAIYNSNLEAQFVRQIASNTSSTITIDGTWSSSVSNCIYTTFSPVILGDGAARWLKLSIIGQDISSGGTGAQRLGIGMGLLGSAIGIYYGTGSPEGIVSALQGSIYLRTDGGSTTTLYIKTSGTGNTGWTAK